MATSIIDPSLHVSSFPSTYVGPGTLIGNTIQTGSQDTELYGYFTSNGNATQINLGFTPLAIEALNTTDGIQWKWQLGVPGADTYKTTIATPAITLDTSGAFTISVDLAGNSILTLSAALCGTAKNICFHVSG